MKRFTLLLLLAGLGLTGFSQKVYFIYLQSEPAQPFYIKLNGKMHSSSASGYLILSKLADSTYTFAVGFNQAGWTEQVFTVKTEQKDHGFLIKNFGEKGWGIFDLQSLSVQYSATKGDTGETKTGVSGKEISPFTDLLSKATGDPSLLEQPPAPKAEPVPDNKTETVKNESLRVDTVVVAPVTEASATVASPVQETDKRTTAKPVEPAPSKTEPEQIKTELVTEKKEEKNEPLTAIPATAEKIQTLTDTVVKAPGIPEEMKVDVPKVPAMESGIVKEEPQVKKEQANPVLFTKSVVTKRSESSTTEGFGLVFFDAWEGGKVDTIRLLIPNPRQVVALIKETPKTEKKFLDIQASAGKPDSMSVTGGKAGQAVPVKPAEEGKTETKPAEKPSATGPCAETASDTDFFTLRKSMAAAEGDEEMIGLAKKYFKQKCFTVAQLKNLGALFLNDEARYNFFDAAYKYTTDKPAFATLETELKDPYYINRFKAMIH